MSSPGRSATLTRGQTIEVELEVVRRGAAMPGDPGLSLDQLHPVIAEVVAGGAAQKAGLRVGDTVLAIDDRPLGILDGTGAEMLLTNHPPGSVVAVTVTSGQGQPRRVSLTMPR